MAADSNLALALWSIGAVFAAAAIFCACVAGETWLARGRERDATERGRRLHPAGTARRAEAHSAIRPRLSDIYRGGHLR